MEMTYKRTECTNNMEKDKLEYEKHFFYIVRKYEVWLFHIMRKVRIILLHLNVSCGHDESHQFIMKIDIIYIKYLFVFWNKFDDVYLLTCPIR